MLFGLVFGVFQMMSNPEQYNVQDNTSVTPEQWLEFDEKTWDDFVTLYNNHNAFMSTMTAFSNGQIDAVTMYSKCQEAESVFGQCSAALNYGESEEEKDYVGVLQSMALSDQLAAKNLKKYLDSGKTGDLADAQGNINAAKEAVETFASNRGKLLVKAGLTDDEIAEKVEADIAALDN